MHFVRHWEYATNASVGRGAQGSGPEKAKASSGRKLAKPETWRTLEGGTKGGLKGRVLPRKPGHWHPQPGPSPVG
jgi:hypothetical protein